MTTTFSGHSELRFTSRVLGQKVVMMERDLDVFEELYTFPRMTFEQLCFKLQVVPSNRKRFRERLDILTKGYCIHTFYGGLGKSPIFALLDRGLKFRCMARALREGKSADDLDIKRITRPRHKDAEKIRRHEIAVTNLGLIQQLSAESHPTAFYVRHRDIFNAVEDKAIQASHKWPVIIEWGTSEKFHLEPDLLSGTGFSDRMDGKNVRYFPFEIDCSSEDMKPNTPLSRGQSILRKLLSYESTIEQGILSDLMGIDHINPLFVFETEKRLEHAVETAMEILTSRKAKDMICFGLQPPDVAENPGIEFAELSWINGHGREVKVLL